MNSDPTVQTTSKYRVILCAPGGAVLGAVVEHDSQMECVSDAEAYGDGLTEAAALGGMKFRVVAGDAYPLISVADPIAFANDWFETYKPVEPPRHKPASVPSVVMFDISDRDALLLASDPAMLDDDELIEQEYTSFRLLRLGEIDRMLRDENPCGIAVMSMLLLALGRLSSLVYNDDPSPIGSPETYGLLSVGFRYDADALMKTRALTFGYSGSFDETADQPPYMYGLARDGVKHGATVLGPDRTPRECITLEQFYADVCRAFVWTFFQIRSARTNDEIQTRRNALAWLGTHVPITMSIRRG